MRRLEEKRHISKSFCWYSGNEHSHS